MTALSIAVSVALAIVGLAIVTMLSIRDWTRTAANIAARRRDALVGRRPR